MCCFFWERGVSGMRTRGARHQAVLWSCSPLVGRFLAWVDAC